MRDIIGHGGGKGGGEQHTHYEATDSLRSTDFARVLDLISEGEILGLAQGMQSVYLDGTPTQNADGSSNFKDITVDFRLGTQTQDPIPGFPDVESEIAVGIELTSTAPWVHAISNTQLNAIRITLGVDALSKADSTNGDILGYQISYQIELATDGGAYVVALSNSFNGKTTGPYHRSARIDLPTATTGWSIRVTRLTANAHAATTADTSRVISYTEVIDAKLRYPMSAIVGVQVDAKQFSSVPTRAYDMYGRIIQVPANYDPVARTYATTGAGTSSGAWDGTFKLAWTSNPAWIFRDLILNDRYGLGDRITDSQVDKWALYKIAQYCDGMVSDGNGGTEPRFTCNVYIQSQKAAYAVLQDLASVFRGITYFSSGTVMVAADMPSDPVYVYTAANVIGGKFNRVGSAKKTRFTVALVSWNDPADMCRAKVEYVEDPEGIKRYGIQQVQLAAFGCRSQGQAHRAGKWALATSRLETGMISFDVGLDGAIAVPGQIVRIADPARMGKRAGGRIHGASGRNVTLDKAPVINVGDGLTAILPTGVSETHAVTAISGDTVTVDADWSTLPLAQSVWSVDSPSLIAPTYRVISVREKDALTYTISATQHEPGKFNLVENGLAIVPQPQTALDARTQTAPASVAIGARTVSLQDVQKLAITISCDPVAGATAYEGAYRLGNGNWIPLARQPEHVFDVIDVLAGTYTAKLAAVNSLGVISGETVSADTVVVKTVNPVNAGIRLTPSAPAFHVDLVGTVTPSSIVFTATLIDLVGTISFSCTGGATSSPTADSVTVTAASLTGSGVTVTASITVNGTTYNSAPCTVSKVQDGANGINGASIYVGQIYQQATSLPATPTGGTFNFTTSALTPPAGWTTTQPASSTTPTWVAAYSFSTSTPGATVTAGTWAAPVVVAQSGANGAPGAPGLNVATVQLYQRNLTGVAPALPSANVTYTFSTGVATGLTNGWVQNLPDPNLGPFVFSTLATASNTASTDIILPAEWSAVTRLVRDGLDGTFSPKLAWEFRNTVDGWFAGGATLTTGSDSILLTSSGIDPQLVSPGISINGSIYDRIRLRVKRTAGSGWDGQAYYATAGHTFDGNYRKTIPDTTITGEWVTLEWDMSSLTYGGTDWKTNTINQIRLDLGGTASDVFEIDWVVIGKVGPVALGDIAPGVDPNANFSSPSRGGAVNDDPAIEHIGAWSLDTGIALHTGAAGAGSVGSNYFYTANASVQNSKATSIRNFVIDPYKTYSLTAVLFAAAGNSRNMYVFTNFYDASGAQIVTGWGGAMSGYTFAGLPPTGAWSRQGATLGAGTSRAIPTNACTCNVGVWFQYSNDASAGVEQDAQDIRLIDITDAVNAQAAATSAAASDATTKANVAATSATSVYMNANGTLSGPSGGGQVTNLPVVDSRGTNPAPNAYTICHLKEFRDCASIGLSTGSSYCILETLKGWADAAANEQAVQWAYVGADEVWKRSALVTATSWGPWIRDLDLSLYTGALNANYTTNTNQLTDGAGLGTTATWGGVTGTGKPADNATVGAPGSTPVGSTPATTVEANAAAGAAAGTKLNSAPSVSISTTVHDGTTAYANGTTTFGSFTANITNGTGPFVISWSLNDDAAEMSHTTLSSYSGATVTLQYASGPTSNCTYGVNPTVTVTDANKLTCSANITRYFHSGTPP